MFNKQISIMKKIFRTVLALFAVGAAFTGCTDYEDDINAINDRLDQLETGKIASVEEQVAALDKTLESVQDAVDALEALNLEELKDEVTALRDKVNAIDLSKYAEKTYVDATFATKEAVSQITTQLGTLTSKVTTLENKWQNEEGVENVADLLAKIKTAKDAASAAQTDATTALGNIKTLKDALGKYAEVGAIQDSLDKKLDIADFDQEFDEALAEALENDGAITGAIASAIQDATNALTARIDALKGKVEDLAKRIQSLVFVPEYADGMATSCLYSVGHFDLSETQTVSATFQVTPKELAAQVAAQKENVFVYVVPVKTRAAADAIVVSGDDLKLTADPKTGRVEVEAQVDGQIRDFAIAMYVADPKVVADAENNADIEGIDAGSYISSAYVQVKFDEEASQLADDFVLYDFDAKKEYPATYEHKAQWADAPAAYTFYEGYDLALNIDGKYYTLAAAAEKLNLGIEALTPKYSHKEELSVPEEKAHRQIVLKEETPFGVTAMMTVENPQNYVGAQMVVDNLFAFYGVSDKDIPVEVLKNTTTYTIVNRQLEIDLKPQSLDWSYEIADKLSSDHQHPYDKPIVFGEVEVLDKPEGYNVFDLTDPAKVEVYLNGKLVPNSPVMFTMEAVASEVAHIAKVSVNSYEFSNKAANSYKVVNTYKVIGDEAPETVTDVTVTFEFTLGQMPATQKIDLGSYEIPFMTPGNKKIIPIEGVEDKAFAGVESYFDSKDVFVGALYVDNSTLTATKKNGKEINPQYTKLNIIKDDSHVRVSASDLTAFEDEFAFETKISTWYGVDYVFTADAYLVAPKYALAPSPEYTSADYKANIRGELVADQFVIKTIDLSKYIKVINLDSGVDKNDVTVKYEMVTKADAKAGIVNVPAINSPEVSVEIPTGTIDESSIEWLTADRATSFTGRELKVKAILYLGKIKLDEQVLTLTTADPITAFSATTKEFKRANGNAPTVGKLWNGLTLNGILTGVKNLVKTDAESLDKIFPVQIDKKDVNANTVYDAEVTFGKEVKVFVGDVEDPLYSKTKYTYDHLAGTVTFTGDDADLVKPVSFEVEATVTYVLDYNTVQSRTIPVRVTFVQK